jgi:hypothetical protein
MVMWSIAFTWRPSSSSCVVIRKLLHFNLLLQNHWANWNQTWYECSLDDPLQSLCFLLIRSTQKKQEGQSCQKMCINLHIYKLFIVHLFLMRIFRKSLLETWIVLVCSYYWVWHKRGQNRGWGLKKINPILMQFLTKCSSLLIIDGP